jgi:predicted PurR-regulated permease PerM
MSTATPPAPLSPPALPPNDWESRHHLQTLVLLLATACGVYVCYRLVVPFMPALTLALALAVMFLPLQRWLEAWLKQPSLAALVAVSLIALIVLIPVTFVGHRLLLQAVSGAQLIDAKVSSGEWRRALELHPLLAWLPDRIERQIDLAGTVKSLTSWLSNAAGSIITGSMMQALSLCVTFYLLFFMLRDRSAALKSLRSRAPLTVAEMDQLLRRVSETIHATIYGLLAVAFVQGLLGGLMFWWLGLPAPLLWGVVMALLAVVPVLGAFVVWLPAALFLLVDGSVGKAVILVLWGMLVVGTIDNLLRPVLVGNRLKLHTALAFMSVVGGLLLFGAPGIILGPVALTVTGALLEIWRNRTVA